MMKNKKYRMVLSVIMLLCLCLCLSACGKNNKTADVKDNTTISQNQTDDKTEDTEPDEQTPSASIQSPVSSSTLTAEAETEASEPGNNTSEDSGQNQDQPKIVHQDNGSGVESIETSDQSGQAEQQPSSGITTEVKPQQGVEPVGESEDPGQTSEPDTPAAPTLSPAAKEYADYCAMSTDEQYAYYKSFKSADAFMEWYNAAKAAYEKENPAVELNPGDVIDLGN